jgi:hypothetical protein
MNSWATNAAVSEKRAFLSTGNAYKNAGGILQPGKDDRPLACKQVKRTFLSDYEQPTLTRSCTTVCCSAQGHWERGNVFTHLVAAVAFGVYGMWRSGQVVDWTVAQILTSASIFVTTSTFVTSSAFHAANPYKPASSTMRFLDHFFIQAAFGLSSLTLVVVSLGHRMTLEWFDVALLDPVLAVLLCCTFFAIRRLSMRSEDTLIEVEYCSLSMRFFEHSDMRHSLAKSVSYLSFTLSFVLASASAFQNLDQDMAVQVLTLQTTAFLLVMFGNWLDSQKRWPEQAIEDAFFNGEDSPFLTKCASCETCGCFVSSHVLWHVFAALSAAAAVASFEVGVLL